MKRVHVSSKISHLSFSPVMRLKKDGGGEREGKTQEEEAGSEAVPMGHPWGPRGSQRPRVKDSLSPGIALCPILDKQVLGTYQYRKESPY